MKKTAYIMLALMLAMMTVPSYAKPSPSQKVMEFMMKKAPQGASVKLIKEIPVGETGFSYLLFDYKAGGQSKQISFVSNGEFVTNSFVELETGKNITEYYEAISKTIEVPVDAGEVYFGDPETAKVNIVVFSDFECPYCRTLSNELQPFFKEHSSEIVAYYKHYPLPFHKNAMLLAKIYEAGKKIGHKYDMYNKDITGKNYEQIMQLFDSELAEDKVPVFYTELNNPEITEKIERNVNEAKEVGVRGTPYILINGHPVSGNKPDLVKEIILSELK